MYKFSTVHLPICEAKPREELLSPHSQRSRFPLEVCEQKMDSAAAQQAYFKRAQQPFLTVKLPN